MRIYSRARLSLLHFIQVNNGISSYITPLALDRTGRYLFVTEVRSQVYDVSPQLAPGPLLLGVRGSEFAYQIGTTFDATSYSSTGLPPGLSVSETGLISGTPEASGEFTASVTGTRGTAQASQTYSFAIDGNRLKNISTRAYNGVDELTMIGGFIIQGSVPKTVVVRVLGPSLAAYGLSPIAKDPAFRLNGPDGYQVNYNNDWGFASDETYAALVATGLAPTDPLESAIIMSLDPGAYTAVLEPGGGGLNTNYNGYALIEVYDVDPNTLSKLANISTRSYTNPAYPEIAGVIATGPGNDNVLIRALGPSLSGSGLSNPIDDPMVELRDANGALIASNNNWKDTQEAEIGATGLAPGKDLEAAILIPLPAGPYTAVLRNTHTAFGVCLVEIYHLP